MTLDEREAAKRLPNWENPPRTANKTVQKPRQTYKPASTLPRPRRQTRLLQTPVTAIPQHITTRCYGPLSWVDQQGHNLLKHQAEGQERGTYLLTVWCDGVYLPHYIGPAFNAPFVSRFATHLSGFGTGYKTVLDSALLARGKQHELRESYLTTIKTRLREFNPSPRGAVRKELRAQFQQELIAEFRRRRRQEFAAHITRMLQLFQLFFIPMPTKDMSLWLEGKLWRLVRADPQLVPFLARDVSVPAPAPCDQKPTITLRWPDGVRGWMRGLENTESLELWI